MRLHTYKSNTYKYNTGHLAFSEIPSEYCYPNFCAALSLFGGLKTIDKCRCLQTALLRVRANSQLTVIRTNVCNVYIRLCWIIIVMLRAVKDLSAYVKKKHLDKYPWKANIHRPTIDSAWTWMAAQQLNRLSHICSFHLVDSKPTPCKNWPYFMMENTCLILEL